MALLNQIHGVLDRRILLNYRADTAVVRKFLPSPFRPRLHNGHAIVGVCMIRFRELRPRLVPAWLGTKSENAAHRIAVEWDQNGQTHQGVYIPHRDTNSWVSHRLGGTLFKAHFSRSQFDVSESNSDFHIQITREDGLRQVEFEGSISECLPSDSIFASLEEASEFFKNGGIGYSVTPSPGEYNGVEMKTRTWEVKPLKITNAYSNLYSDETIFPAGSVTLDNALIMQGLEHDWISQPTLRG